MASLPKLSVVSCERHDNPSYRYEGKFRQAEKLIVFQYTLSGEGRFRSGNETSKITPGKGFLCEVYDPATAYFYPSGAKEPWEFIFITFSGITAVAIVRDIIQRHGAVFDLNPECRILKHLKTWSAYGGTSVKISAPVGASMIFELLMTLSESKELYVLQSPSNRIVSEACAVIDNDISNCISVTGLAAKLSISREHLTRLFKMELGQTPHEYITRRKLLLACRLLKDSSLSGKVICERLGGITHQHFVRMFKKELKMTPSKFRKVGMSPMW
jgi:AraC-like DNA-binding protein